MKRPCHIAGLVCLAVLAALAACQSQQPAPPQEPAPLTGEALKQRQHQIALESRDIVQQIRDSMAAAREPDSVKLKRTFGAIWKVGDQTIDMNGAYDYLKPSEFPGMPEEIAAWLEERNYTIPQVIPRADTLYVPEFAKPHNAFSGQLSDKKQTDWLVYCNSGQDTSILIFWNSSTENIERLNDLVSFLDIDCCGYLIHSINTTTILRELSDVLDLNNVDSKKKLHLGVSIGLYETTVFQMLYKSNGKWILFNSSDE